MTRPVYVLGSGGHAGVLLNGFRLLTVPVAGILDPNSRPGTQLGGVTVVGGDEILESLDADQCDVAIGVGANPDVSPRRRLFETARSRGLTVRGLVHPAVTLADNAFISSTTQVMAGAIIQPNARIGDNVIINTGSILEHDCTVEDHAVVSTGTVLCGGASVGEQAFLGAGVMVAPDCQIGAGAIVGAGAVVVRSVPSKVVAFGNPARVVRRLG